jgi:hypothetical protein
MTEQPMTTAGLQAKVRLRRAWFEAYPNQPTPESRAEVDALLAAIEEEAVRDVRVAPSPTAWDCEDIHCPHHGIVAGSRFSVAPSPTEDPVTCANCERVVDEVDAEEGTCRECYAAFHGVAPSPEHTDNGLVPTHARRPGDSAADGGEALPDRLSGSNRSHPSQPDASRSWREAARDLHATGDDEPYADVAPSPDAPGLPSSYPRCPKCGGAIDIDACRCAPSPDAPGLRDHLFAAVDDVRDKLAAKGQPANPGWVRMVKDNIETVLASESHPTKEPIE